MDQRVYEIALFIPPTPGYLSDVVSGVQECARALGNWAVETCYSLPLAEAHMSFWKPDGILLNATDGDWAPLIRRLGIPTVQIGGNAIPGIPQVRTDNAAIGELAAKYLLERGFSRFACMGYAYVEWSQNRRNAFERMLKSRGFESLVFEGQRGWIHANQVTGRIADWVRTLPKPIAVFACHDRAAMLLGHACAHLGIRVPEDVAILGVDNNLFECGFTHQPISSVMGSARRIGYHAAAMLDQLMHGRPVESKLLLVQPAGVETRASTDIFAVADPDVAASLRYIEKHADAPIMVKDVAKAVFATRRMLERKFKDLLHSSPRERILLAHLQRAKRLLIHTQLSMLDVGLRSGFLSGSQFSTVFKREIGIGPTEFRRLYGVSTAAAPLHSLQSQSNPAAPTHSHRAR